MIVTPLILEDLRAYGFSYLTSWELRADRNKPVSTDWDSTAGWIYAFVTEASIKYIGIATTVLRSRLDGYSYQINDRVGELVREQLGQGTEVAIYGIRRSNIPKGELKLEESKLIEDFKPDWNVQA